MMRKVTIELDWDTVDRIVVQELGENLKTFIASLKQIQSIGITDGIFSQHPEEDAKKLEEHIKACKLMIAYHKPFSEQ
jgi:hypothetical protein